MKDNARRQKLYARVLCFGRWLFSVTTDDGVCTIVRGSIVTSRGGSARVIWRKHERHMLVAFDLDWAASSYSSNEELESSLCNEISPSKVNTGVWSTLKRHEQ